MKTRATQSLFLVLFLLAMGFLASFVLAPRTEAPSLKAFDGLTSPSADSGTALPISINITAAELDAAQARWKAASIEEYDISFFHISMIGGYRRLHVSKGQVQVLEDSHYDKAHKKTYPYIDIAAADPVEELFEDVRNSLLAGPDANYYLVIQFDAVLGYPTSIVSYPQPNSQLTDQYSSKSVSVSNIVKRQTSPTSSP